MVSKGLDERYKNRRIVLQKYKKPDSFFIFVSVCFLSEMSFNLKDKTGDEILIKAMADGDMDAFATIYKRYAPAMLHFVTGLIKNKAKAEDIVQNIFLRMAASKPVFESVASLKNWLFVCARNEVVSTLRSKWESAVERVPVYPETVSDAIQPEAMMPILNSVLARMPEKRSEVFRMSRIEGLSVEDIAARMGISVRTVQKHLEIANREVRKSLN